MLLNNQAVCSATEHCCLIFHLTLQSFSHARPFKLRRSKHRQSSAIILTKNNKWVHCVVDQTFVILLLSMICCLLDLPDISRSVILKSSPKSKNFDRRVFLFSFVGLLQYCLGFVKASTTAEMFSQEIQILILSQLTRLTYNSHFRLKKVIRILVLKFMKTVIF